MFVDDEVEPGRLALGRYCRASYGLPLAALARYEGPRHILFSIGALEPDVLTDRLAASPW